MVAAGAQLDPVQVLVHLTLDLVWARCMVDPFDLDLGDVEAPITSTTDGAPFCVIYKPYGGTRNGTYEQIATLRASCPVSHAAAPSARLPPPSKGLGPSARPVRPIVTLVTTPLSAHRQRTRTYFRAAS